ncbi:MAG: pentapeptide repeat-containing protein [Spirosomataceae bacterium]
MKYVLSFALILISLKGVVAQKEVVAKEVFAAIDHRQSVQYDGVTIVGDLDLTELSNRKTKKQSHGWEEIKSIVEVPVVFRNCTFKGDVIAYKHLKDGKTTRIFNLDLGDGGITYSTDFREGVVFENCNFGGNSEFKYSTFAKNVNFSGSKFQNQANFKYAVFKNDAYFSGIRFEEYANFKYADFSDKRISKTRVFVNMPILNIRICL